MNITELARKLKITPNELRQALPELGFHIGPRAIQIPDKQAEKVVGAWQKKRDKELSLQKIKEKISKRAGEKEITETDKSVFIPPTIRVYNLAEKLNLPITKVIGELIKNGVLVSINENLDFEVAAIVSENLGFEPKKGEPEQKKSNISIEQKIEQILLKEHKNKLKPRAPVVVVMGHVDHGKTLLLDSIRQTHLTEKEAGGITQHIGAYQVERNGHLVTFIDTPGHEAFQAMRARGGAVADIAVLVIAADDKVQPQTLESIKVIQQENLPFIVAINKIDLPEADVEKIKKGLSEINLIPEDWGGKVICVPVSAKTNEGIPELLEMINLVAEMGKKRLIFNPLGQVVGAIIEAHLDSGLGPVASLILYNGTLKKGDNVIIGESYGRIRSIRDQFGELIVEAEASLPIQISGLRGVPKAGDIIEVVANNREFKKRVKQMSAADIYQKEAEGGMASEQAKNKVKWLNLILRADVLGSLEAIAHSLEKLEYPEVKIKIIKKGLGNLNESDVDLAKTSQAWLIGFGVEIISLAEQLANELNLKVSTYSVIYDLIRDVKERVNELLPEKIFEQRLGKVEILKVFQSRANEIILGGRVTKGKIVKNSPARVWKAGEQELKGEGKIGQLQINKRDVEEAKEISECGIKFISRMAIDIGDILEVYQEIKKKKGLDKEG